MSGCREPRLPPRLHPPAPPATPPGRGVENTRQDPGYPVCGFFSKIIFSKKKFVRYAPPLDPPFFQFFQFWTTGAPFYIFFFYYFTVFLFIFSLFLFTFFSIIECRAVVIQPPQFILNDVRLKEASDSLHDKKFGAALRRRNLHLDSMCA